MQITDGRRRTVIPASVRAQFEVDLDLKTPKFDETINVSHAGKTLRNNVNQVKTAPLTTTN